MDTQTDAKQDSYGKRVLLYFVMFFGVIIVVNAVFIYSALNSFTGVVTENPYEKGLAYNETLAKAKEQPKMNDRVSYNNGILQWNLVDNENIAIDTATVTASLVRPVQDGYDFDTTLKNAGNGEYKATLDLPLKGLWQAHLKATWNNTQYQTTYEFQAK